MWNRTPPTLHFRDLNTANFSFMLIASMRYGFAVLLMVLLSAEGVMAQNHRATTYGNEPERRSDPKTDSAGLLRYRQFGGGTLYVRGVGGSINGYSETIDGYTIILNEEGIYEYAEADKDGDLQTSGFQARDPEDRGDKARKFLSKTPRHLRYTGEAAKKRRKRRDWLYKTLPKKD